MARRLLRFRQASNWPRARFAIARLITNSYRTVKTARGAVAQIRQIRRRVPGSSPIRLLHAIETGGPGGAERMLVELAGRLGPEYDSTVGLLKPGWLKSLVMSSGIPCAMLNGGGDIGIVANLLRFVHEQRIELIHAHEFYMSTMAAAISRLTGIPVVVTVHGKNYYPEKRRRRVVYRMVSRQAAGVVTVSQDLRWFFCRTTGTPTNRVRVIYNGIDPGPLRDVKRDLVLLGSVQIPPTAAIVGTIGNLYPVKGHVDLIRATSLILQSCPDTHLVMLGRGGLRDVLSTEAAASGVRDRVHLLGYTDQVPRWLGAMDVFVLSSLSEGLPLSLLEAMAAGKPTVVTAVGGMPEVVRDGQTGFLVPPGDPDALAQKVAFLLQNSAVAAGMGAAGRSRVQERFSVDQMVAEYRGLYEEALAPHADAVCHDVG